MTPLTRTLRGRAKLRELQTGWKFNSRQLNQLNVQHWFTTCFHRFAWPCTSASRPSPWVIQTCYLLTKQEPCFCVLARHWVTSSVSNSPRRGTGTPTHQAMISKPDVHTNFPRQDSHEIQLHHSAPRTPSNHTGHHINFPHSPPTFSIPTTQHPNNLSCCSDPLFMSFCRHRYIVPPHLRVVEWENQTTFKYLGFMAHHHKLWWPYTMN